MTNYCTVGHFSKETFFATIIIFFLILMYEWDLLINLFFFLLFPVLSVISLLVNPHLFYYIVHHVPLSETIFYGGILYFIFLMPCWFGSKRKRYEDFAIVVVLLSRTFARIITNYCKTHHETQWTHQETTITHKHDQNQIPYHC